jgi:hypothetical protein
MQCYANCILRFYPATLHEDLVLLLHQLMVALISWLLLFPGCQMPHIRNFQPYAYSPARSERANAAKAQQLSLLHTQQISGSLLLASADQTILFIMHRYADHSAIPQ